MFLSLGVLGRGGCTYGMGAFVLLVTGLMFWQRASTYSTSVLFAVRMSMR